MKRMTLKSRNLLWYGALACLLSAGCSDDFAAQCEVDYDTAKFESLPVRGGETTFEIRSNTEWEIETDIDWAFAAPHKGDADATVRLYIEPNAEETRSGTLKIKFPRAKQKNYTITVTQPFEFDTSGTDFDDNFLGYGYNIFGLYANNESKSNGQVLSLAKLKARQDSIDLKKIWADNVLDSDYSRKFDYTAHTGKTYEEVSQSFKIDAGISASYMLFSAEMKASFAQNSNETREEEFAIYSYNVNLGKRIITRAAVDDYEMWISASAKKAINGLISKYSGSDGIKRLVENYGTHVIVGGHMGGRLDYSMVVDKAGVTSDFNIAAMVKGGYGSYFKANVETEEKQMYERNSSHSKTSVKCIGGNKSVITVKDIDLWFNSVVNEGKSVLMGFDQYDLVPIWEFCDDPQRSREIENFIVGEYYEDAVSDIYNTQYKRIDIEEFSAEPNISLVRRAEIDGVPVAEICNEYIPGISGNSRVTVVYPIVNNATQHDCGFFIGNDFNPPAKVVWTSDATYPKITRLSGYPIGAQKTIYMKGRNIATSISTGVDFIVCDIKDFAMPAKWYGSAYNYPVVKVGKNYWTRRDYYGHHGQYDDGRHYNGWHTSTIYDLLVNADWEMPTREQVEQLMRYVNNESEKLRIKSITGFDIEKSTWYIHGEGVRSGVGTWWRNPKGDYCGYWLKRESDNNIWFNIYTNGTMKIEPEAFKRRRIDPQGYEPYYEFCAAAVRYVLK